MTHSRTTRRSKVLFGAIAAAALSIAVTDSAHAGKREATAISKALEAAGASTFAATPDQLAAAVTTVINANPKWKPGVIAGEALKTTAAISSAELPENEERAGTAIADAVIAIIGATGDRVTVTADAAKTAGVGKTGNVTQVDEFSAATIVQNSDAVLAAEKAKASKVGAGAIIQGVASTLADDAAKIALANSALASKKLASVMREVAAGASVGVADPAQFAISVTNTKAKIGVKIAPGVVSSNPESAAAIVAGLFTSGDAALLAKAAPALAKSVAAVADVEQISNIALVFGRQIGSNAIKVSKAAGLAKTLTAAIVAKTTLGVGDRLSIENKGDEVAEVAAFIVAGLTANTGALTVKAAPKLVLAIIKSAIAGGKAKKKATPLTSNYIADIAGSVALTIQNSSLATDVKAKIQEELLKKAKTIAGKANEALITAALTEGAALNGRYEDGNLANTSPLFVVDAETDDRGYTEVAGAQR